MLSQIFDINKALANSKLLKVWEDVFGWLSFFSFISSRNLEEYSDS